MPPTAQTCACNSGDGRGFPLAHNFLDPARKSRAFLKFPGARSHGPSRPSAMRVNSRAGGLPGRKLISWCQENDDATDTSGNLCCPTRGFALAFEGLIFKRKPLKIG